MEIGRHVILIFFSYLNAGIAAGLIFAAMLVLRPVTNRLLTPQQRAVLWLVGWMPAYLLSLYEILGWFHILPVTFRDLITPRTDGSIFDLPAYLPAGYRGTGSYNLVLPGGLLVQVELTWAVVTGMLILWLAGMAVVGAAFGRRSRAIRALIDRGEAVPWDEPWLSPFPDLRWNDIQVRLCSGLPTSFLFWGHAKGEQDVKYTICLQQHLSPERRELILRHELAHQELKHSHFKAYANSALLLYWWNPLIWLAHKYFCRDLELACDRAVLKKLDLAQRREYARTLVELAAGRQLWDAPLCFGECDAVLRVRAAVDWKPPRFIQRAASAAVFILLLLFFIGGPAPRQLPEDMLLDWQNSGGTAATLIEDAQRRLKEQGVQGRAEHVWCANGPVAYTAYLYVQISDGSWWRVEYLWRSNVDVLRSISAVGLEERPEVGGMYRLA